MFMVEVNCFLPNCDSHFLFASPAKPFLPLARPFCAKTPISEYCLLTMPLQDTSYCLHKILHSLQCHFIVLLGSTDSNMEVDTFSAL